MDLAGYWNYIGCISAIRLSQNKTSRHVSKYGEDIEILGAAGELAARLLLGLSTILETGFDDGHDLVWKDWLVDVKTTRLTPRIEYRYLQWPKGKPMSADIVLMMAVDLEGCRAIEVGWEYGCRVVEAPVNYSRDYPCHEIPMVALRPFWQFYAIEERQNGKETI